jgi:hypothetical protein
VRLAVTLRAPLGNQCQEKKRQLQKSELEHDSLQRKAYTTTSFWRQLPAAMIYIYLRRNLQQ